MKVEVGQAVPLMIIATVVVELQSGGGMGRPFGQPADRYRGWRAAVPVTLLSSGATAGLTAIMLCLCVSNKTPINYKNGLQNRYREAAGNTMRHMGACGLPHASLDLPSNASRRVTRDNWKAV